MFKNILVAVDGSDNSKKALDHALELAKKCDGKITLIHVYSTVVPVGVPSTDTLAAPEFTPVSASLAAKLSEEAKQRGKQILERRSRLRKGMGFRWRSF